MYIDSGIATYFVRIISSSEMNLEENEHSVGLNMPSVMSAQLVFLRGQGGVSI